MRTLIGGTFPSSVPGCCGFEGGGGSPLIDLVGPPLFFLLDDFEGCGLVVLGGVMVGLWSPAWAGGVGMGS